MEVESAADGVNANPGRFTDEDREELSTTLRLSALAHAELALHFGHKLAERGSGGLLFVGAMGADTGVPFMAHDGGAKGYVQSLNAEADFIGGTNPLFI